MSNSDIETARKSLAFAVGASVDVSGIVQKRVKREGQCKLVIEPGASVPGFIVFADCLKDAENYTKLYIRKGSSVRVKGKVSDVWRVGVLFVRLPFAVKTGEKREHRKNTEQRPILRARGRNTS